MSVTVEELKQEIDQLRLDVQLLQKKFDEKNKKDFEKNFSELFMGNDMDYLLLPGEESKKEAPSKSPSTMAIDSNAKLVCHQCHIELDSE